jgi:hypothetical protein
MAKERKTLDDGAPVPEKQDRRLYSVPVEYKIILRVSAASGKQVLDRSSGLKVDVLSEALVLPFAPSSVNREIPLRGPDGSIQGKGRDQKACGMARFDALIDQANRRGRGISEEEREELWERLISSVNEDGQPTGFGREYGTFEMASKLGGLAWGPEPVLQSQLPGGVELY